MAEIPKKETHSRELHSKGHAGDHAGGEKTTQNIQDVFLNTLRKERATVTIFLMGGVKLTGKIRSFDKYSVILENSNQEQLVFKHAISTVVVAKGAPQQSPAAQPVAEV